MPWPQNLEMAREVEEIVRKNGAEPATIAILDGRVRIGLSDNELERLARAGVGGPDEQTANVLKCGAREIPLTVARGGNGATTVSGTAALAHRFGIRHFATGGIGGVHRGAETTFDISADLTQLVSSQVAVVCAGVKSVLDIPKTLEYLETQGVPVITYTGPIPDAHLSEEEKMRNVVASANSSSTIEFPAFFSPRSGVPSPACESSLATIAEAMRLSIHSFRWRRGQIVAVPPPESVEGEQIEEAIRQALKEAESKKIAGRDVTPFLLARINQLTEGASLKANIALVKRNAAVAARLAVEFRQAYEKRKAESQEATGKEKPKEAGAGITVGVKAASAVGSSAISASRPGPQLRASGSPTPTISRLTSLDHLLATGSGAAEPDTTKSKSRTRKVPPAAAPGPLHSNEQRRRFSSSTAASSVSSSVEPPKVVVIGGSVVDIISRPKEGASLVPGTSNPGVVTQTFGGVGELPVSLQEEQHLR
jgi:pseudouridine-5'-phosphate glycosidase